MKFSITQNIILLFFLLLFANNLIAQQPCNDEVIMNKKGSWKKLNDANAFPDPDFPKSQFPQANSRIDKMQNLLQAAYPEPNGMEAGWYRNISGHPVVKAGPFAYALQSLFLAYHCSYEKKIESETETRKGETGTWLFVLANQLHSWFAEFIKYYVIQKQPVYLLPKKKGTLNGYPLYEGNYNRTGERYSRAIILTRTGQSPYLPVIQKQFLKTFLNYNEKRFVKSLDAQEKRVVKTDAEEEVNKKKFLETLERTTPANKLDRAKDNFLQNYVTDKQQKEKWIVDMKKRFEQDMKPARQLLADSLKPALQQPVIIDFDNLLEFKEFTTEEKGGRQLVRLNPDYFDMSLPKYVPQLLIAHWSWDDRKPANEWRTRIEKNFDFNALKEMLDK